MKRLILLILMVPNFALYAQMSVEVPYGQSIETISAHFKGTPYCNGPLGEGPNGKYDKDPLCATYDFDCQTYVETVLAMNRSRNQQDFEQQMNQIRYREGTVRYETRLHFSETQWIPHNQERGYFTDISCELSECTEEKIEVDYAKWYQAKKPSDLVGVADSKALMDEWHDTVPDGEPDPVPFTYIAKEKITPEFVKTIPSPSVIVILRKSESKAGSWPVMVTHMGLVIDTSEGKILRHATPLKEFQRVVDTNLTTYLESFKTQSSAKGFKILKINPLTSN